MYTFLLDAGIDLRSVFLNADGGFDAEELRLAYAQRETEANIVPIKRNEKRLSDNYLYFDKELYKQLYVIKNKPMPGSMALKPC